MINSVKFRLSKKQKLNRVHLCEAHYSHHPKLIIGYLSAYVPLQPSIKMHERHTGEIKAINTSILSYSRPYTMEDAA